MPRPTSTFLAGNSMGLVKPKDGTLSSMHSGNGSHTIEIVLNQKFVLHVLLAVSPKKLSRFVCNYEVGEACK